MTIYLPVGSVLFVDTSTNDTPVWQKLTEHNRTPVAFDNQRIEQQKRMADGSLRKLWIADKKTISTSWNMLPSYSTMTVDGGYGAEDIRSFYYGDKGKNTFKIKIAYSDTRTEILNVTFTSANFTVTKRNVKNKATDSAQEFWDVSIALEQV